MAGRQGHSLKLDLNDQGQRLVASPRSRLCVTEGNLQRSHRSAVLNLLQPNPFRSCCESRQIGPRYARDHLFMTVDRLAMSRKEEPPEGKGIPCRMSAIHPPSEARGAEVAKKGVGHAWGGGRRPSVCL